jgi:CRP-like cAMP-binding protein
MSETPHSPERLLEHIDYLRDLPAAERVELARVSQLRQVARGERVFAEATPATGIFLIVSGRVRLVRTSFDGREQVLHEEGPRATLAEVPVFDGGGYVATAIATEDATVLMVPRAALLRALASRPSSALAVIAVLAARVRKLATLASDLSFKPVVDRLAAYLLRESERTGTLTVVLPDTREELSSHIGTVREQASRALSQLARAGVIDVRGRHATIRNRPQLQAFAASEDDPRPTGD